MQKWLPEYLESVRSAPLRRERGEVLDCNGLVIEASGPDAAIGELCQVEMGGRSEPVLCEVVGLKAERLLLMPYGHVQGITRGSAVLRLHRSMQVPVGDALLGRVIDAFGKPLDGRGDLGPVRWIPRDNPPLNPLERKPITEPVETGVRAIDALLTLGKGQRMGVFAGSGVGKSTLLGMLARNVSSEVNVIVLVGERGREVWDFIEHALGAAGMQRSIVVVATADQPALTRIQSVYAATAIAEGFRDAGRQVLLIVDSITRFAMARREVGLAGGEPPTTRGYTPSVFSVLPQLLERCGNFGTGSITAIYSVLVEGDDMNEPIADHMRAALDGHLVLSRDLAARGHYPAIDVTKSISRLMPAVTSMDERRLVRRAIGYMARVEDARDLIDMGAYSKGSNPELDEALACMKPLTAMLMQDQEESTSRAAAMGELTRACTPADGGATKVAA